jgi:hypothetical protein
VLTSDVIVAGVRAPTVDEAIRRGRELRARRVPRFDDAPPTMTGGRDWHDRRTHIERLNPGENPAHVPGHGIVHRGG